MTATLDPGPPELGGKICDGAEAGDFYWGVGVDGDAGRDDRCLGIPTAGTIIESRKWVCNRAGGAAGVQVLARIAPGANRRTGSR